MLGYSVLTGVWWFPKKKGYKLEDATLQYLGEAEKVTIDKDNTTIQSSGKGKKSDIEGRVNQIKAQIGTHDFRFIDKEKLQERLAKLAGGVAVIYVGASQRVEMKKRKRPVLMIAHCHKKGNPTGQSWPERFLPIFIIIGSRRADLQLMHLIHPAFDIRIFLWPNIPGLRWRLRPDGVFSVLLIFSFAQILPCSSVYRWKSPPPGSNTPDLGRQKALRALGNNFHEPRILFTTRVRPVLLLPHLRRW